MTERQDGAVGDSPDSRPYSLPSTPRTYISAAWQDPSRRREILDYLAEMYDWYLDRMIPAKLRDMGWEDPAEAEACAEAVKERFFMPENAVLRDKADSFWLGRWDREKGPLRNYFRTCVRNRIVDWCRSGGLKGKGEARELTGLMGSADDDGAAFAEPAASGPTPDEEVEQREFEARYDKKLFLEGAIKAYQAECGDDTEKWQAYKLLVSAWPQPEVQEIADALGITHSAANNHVHRGRVRVQELLWWLIRGLEMDDLSADRAMLELTGKVPACREKGVVPRPGNYG